MKDFILEIGKDFTYVGEEYRVQVLKQINDIVEENNNKE